ncbi:MAG: hypothetical protein ACREQ3_21555 [Candidatus Binatia bacterium]
MKFIATFHGATRKGNSVNGNPKWVLHTSEGDIPTQTDAALGYEIGNITGGTDSLVGSQAEFSTTVARRGPGERVWNVRRLTERVSKEK